jgi:bifunctional non-homologous end joining protein LigD
MTEPFLPLTQCKTMQSYEFESLRGDWLMEPKIDGWRIQMDVTPTAVHAWTRTAHDATGKMPGVEHHLKHLTAGKHSFRLDGEAVYIDEDGVPDYNFTGRCLGSGVDVCVMKQREVGSLSYFVFDILILDGEDCRPLALASRKDLIKDNLSSTGSVELVLGTEPTYEQHIANFDQYKEGSVLKDFSSPYMGKRHKSWLKWKEVETVDAKIVGYKRGQGKFEGLVGAIRFEAPDGTQGYCSGMDDTTRVWITDHRRELLGSIIEVKHFGKLVDGYRHPQFMRFREDKV